MINKIEAESRTEVFIKLLADHERSLMRYALSLVPNQEDASDILQDSKILMWEKFDSFTIGTNFPAWARQVIFYRVLKYRRQPARRNSPFSEETIQFLDQGAIHHEEPFNQRAACLGECIKELSSDHRQIITLRYLDDKTIEEIAEIVDRTPAAVYRVLSRIRRNLRESVSRSLLEVSEP